MHTACICCRVCHKQPTFPCKNCCSVVQDTCITHYTWYILQQSVHLQHPCNQCHTFHTLLKALQPISRCLGAAGGSLRSIAEAKAGIMKPNRPVVIARQPLAEALEVLQWHAKQLNCPVLRPREVIWMQCMGFEHTAEGVLQRVKAIPVGMPWFQETGKCSLV